MTRTNTDLLELARKLPIPVPWNRHVFIENLAEQRGRPIRLFPTDTAALVDSPCGMWAPRDNDDLIFYENGTSESHMDQIICHEIGHMVLRHGNGKGIGQTAQDIARFATGRFIVRFNTNRYGVVRL